jgi:hypothetical protein
MQLLTDTKFTTLKYAPAFNNTCGVETGATRTILSNSLHEKISIYKFMTANSLMTTRNTS